MLNDRNLIYRSPSHCLTVNVLLNNITFLWFLLFSMCHSLHVTVNKCISWCFVNLFLLFYYNNMALSYWWSVMTMRLSCTDTEIWGFKIFGVTSLTFWGHVTSLVTWSLLSIWGFLLILGSQFWPFGVTWHHRSHDHIGLGVGTFLLVVNDDYASILHGYGDMALQRLWGHDLDLLGSRDVISNVTTVLSVVDLLWVVHSDHASSSTVM